MRLPIELDHARIAAFCRRNQIRKLSLFGSVLRDDFGPDSDVDILVEFEPEAVVGLLKMVTLEQELTAIVGRRVDLRTAQDLSRYFRDAVLAEAVVEYAA